MDVTPLISANTPAPLEWRMGGALFGGTGRGFLLGSTPGVYRKASPDSKLPLCILCSELTRKTGRPERLENGLGRGKKKEKPSPASCVSDPEERCSHQRASDSRSRREGLMRGRLRRGLEGGLRTGRLAHHCLLASPV